MIDTIPPAAAADHPLVNIGVGVVHSRTLLPLSALGAEASTVVSISIARNSCDLP